MSTPTHQDDLARLLSILADGPPEGMSFDDIQLETAKGELWSLRTINALLCDLGSQVKHEKVRLKTGRKATKYYLKDSRP